jgi:VIT1/CCC1 family predicted Fe2+/Mn2+ transporter
MAKSSGNWSEQRRIMAPRIASVLYGVIAIMTVDLAVQPDRLGYAEAASGVLLIGLAMTMTRIFVRVVTKEAEIGSHLPMREFGAIGRDSLLVMLFPIITALLIVAAALVTARWLILLDVILYFGMAAVFVIGFLSSYILDRDIRPALSRGVVWLLLILVIVAAKKLA